MSRRAAVAAIVLCACAWAAGATTPVPASTGSRRVEFASREWIPVELDVGGVRLDRVRLHPPGRVRALMLRHDESNRGRVVVTNGTDKTVSPAVAIAVFDDEGYLLAAANSGAKMKAVRPGATVELELHLGGVFLKLDRAKWIYLSLEY